MKTTFVARELIRIARMLVAKDWTTDIQRKRPDLDSSAVNDVLRSYEPKEQKMVAYWLLDKKTIDFPFDQNTGKSIEQAYAMLNDPLNTKLKLDFMRFGSPSELVKFVNGQASSGGVRTKFNPDTEPTFSNKKSLGNGVVVYEVEDSKAGQIAVRKALDDAWGVNFNGWCLAARKSNFGPRQLEEFDQLTESQKERLGFYSEDDLAVAWGNWNVYNKTPKRAAFKGGKIFAFSASSKRDTVLWWDKSNSSSHDIPGVNVLDDFDFLVQYGKENIVMNPKYRDKNPELFDNIMNDAELKRKIARDKDTSPDTLAKMWNDEDNSVRRYVAGNENTSPDILAKMWNDEDYSVRRNVAKNQSTPSDTLANMWDDKSYEIRNGVAGNRNTPPDILAKMWDDEDRYVRYYVAGNPNTPSDTLAKMWNDEDYSVRRNVAGNPNTPPDILAKMWDDEDKYIRQAVAKNQSTPSDILAKMWDDGYYEARKCVAGNENTPSDILAKMWNDEVSYVRRNVAGNPNTPSDTLAKMRKDKSDDVREAVLKNPNYMGR